MCVRASKKTELFLSCSSKIVIRCEEKIQRNSEASECAKLVVNNSIFVHRLHADAYFVFFSRLFVQPTNNLFIVYVP